VLAAGGVPPGGAIQLLHFNADGSPDQTVRHRIQLKAFDGRPYGGKTDAVMTSKGSYVILGASQEKPDDLLIAAVKSNGKVEGNFGKGGTVRLDYRDRIPMRPQGTLVQRDGKIVTWAPLFYPEDVWLISRMNPDGTPDKSFGGGDGLQTIRWKGNWAYVDFMASEADDGKLLIAGPHPKGGSIVMRLKDDGSRDQGFGNRGAAKRSGEMFIPSLLQELPDGSVLLGGHEGSPGVRGSALPPRAIPRGRHDRSLDERGI
jgi:hypothetical protein